MILIQGVMLFFSYQSMQEKLPVAGSSVCVPFWFYSIGGVRKLIRGEVMKREIGLRERRKYPGQFLFGLGFLLGVILPNFMYRTQWHQSTVSSVYLMGIFSGDSSTEYFWQVLKMRGGLFLLASCSGVTIFGIPVAVMGMLAGGVLTGMLLTVSVLQFGLNGGLIGAGLLFPQYLLYLPCLFIGLDQIYDCSAKLWKNRSFSAGQITTYLLKMFLCAALCLAGIFLEVYCNPKITEILIKNLKIF